MKIIIAISALFAGFVNAEDLCPDSRETECITDVNQSKILVYSALKMCDRAAKAKGKDQQADLMCIKYASTCPEDCWPCICQIAKDSDIKVKGCDKMNLIIQ